MDPLNPPAIHGEAVAGRAHELRKRIRALAGDLTKNTFDIAELFLEAQTSSYYLQWGFESLGEYASLELGIKHRKAQYLARIVRVCRECGVARKDYEPVGVTKLREITSLDPGASYFNTETKEHEPMVEHIVALIAEALELSTLEVEQRVAILKGQTGDNAMVPRAYKVTQSAWDNVVSRCFESVRKRAGSAGRDETGKAKEYTDGQVIEWLCAEYNADPRNFLEEPDESNAQIEVPSEENDNATTVRSTDSGETSGLGVPQEAQNSFSQPVQPFVISTEN